MTKNTQSTISKLICTLNYRNTRKNSEIFHLSYKERLKRTQSWEGCDQNRAGYTIG